MYTDEEFEAAVNRLRESIDSGEEVIGEKLGQYRSECALYGDAGPGMHPSCWRPEIESTLAQEYAKLHALLDTPQGEALLAKEAQRRQEMLAQHYDECAVLL